MLRKKTKNNPNNSTAAIGKEFDSRCVITAGTQLDGNFNASENIRFDGALIGDLKCDKKVVVGKEAKIEGHIRANEAVIMGTVIGNIAVSGLLTLQNTANITGNIKATQFEVESGAIYNGECKIGA